MISSVTNYEDELFNAFVVAKIARRRQIIKDGADKLASEIGGKAVLSNQLLDEVSGLNEWPIPLIGSFDEEYLKIPHEILISVMQQHQKYFHVIGPDGHLMPYFITVSNLISKDPKQVSEGNERVIKSRLADAKFFYENDTTKDMLDEAVRWVIIIIVLVFDPLAVLLLIAGNMSILRERNKLSLIHI